MVHSSVFTSCRVTGRRTHRASPAPAVRARHLTVMLASAVAMCAAAFAAAPAFAQTPPGPFATPPVEIHSGGPLTRIFTGRRFQCQVDYADDGQYFPPDSRFGQCGTYITLGGEPGGTLYGQPFSPDLVALGIKQLTPSLAWSQPGVTGTGTAADPYTNKTTVRLPGTDVYVRENVRYVTGDIFYRSDIIVQNLGSADVSFRLYRAADCHPVTGGPFGLGYGVSRDDGNGLTSVGCSQNPNNTPGGWVQSLVPLTGPNGYQQTLYTRVWGRLANTRPLTNFADSDVELDGAMALSWADTLPAGGQATYSSLAGFSPDGVIPPNPLTPEPLPPDEPPAGTPEDPGPSTPPPPPSGPATLIIPDNVFTGRNSGVAGVSARCRAVGSRTPRACIIEIRRGNQRHVFVLGPRGIAALKLRLTAAQRARLRRDCATDTTFSAIVYQPSGRRARNVRRVVQVLCARLRRQACTANATVFTATLDGQATLAALRSREHPRPRAHAAC